VAVCRALAELADGPRTSAHYLRRILEREPYDEHTHLDLVSALARGRAQGETIRAYRTYVARMGEIGVAPASLAPLGGLRIRTGTRPRH
jgi:DNA-binding SARP family transcriptional activator